MEFAAGRAGGYARLGAVEQALTTGAIIQAEPMSTAEHELLGELLRTFGAGEALCIALARHREGVVVTDDRMARRRCLEFGIRVTGTIGVLKAMSVSRTISAAEADALLAGMEKNGFYSPIRRIGDLV